jgi:hypothetical protein
VQDFTGMNWDGDTARPIGVAKVDVTAHLMDHLPAVPQQGAEQILSRDTRAALSH